jgi:hypothetical protein
MQNTKLKNNSNNAVSTKATVYGGVGCGQTPYNATSFYKWVNTHAQGQLANVQIVPLANVKLGSAKPLPFGYGGSGQGVRATIQNSMLNAHKNNTSLAVVLANASKLGHSAKNPICLFALLNGGYSPSSSYWGTCYIKLVVQPTAS